jgi:hypothetical protein
MNRILTIAGLTWKAAFRYRLFWVLTALLAASVVAFPLLLKDDGSARGLTQILLTYSLSAITSLLGFSTLWLSCNTLAGDIEECQMQVVSVKPVSRWQIWLGKWVGIVCLNAALIALSGTAVFILLQARAHALSPQEQAVLRKEIFVARAAVKPVVPDISAEVDRIMKLRLKDLADSPTPPNVAMLQKETVQMIWARMLSVPPDNAKGFRINLGDKARQLRGKPLQARIKFRTGNPNAQEGTLYDAIWHVGPANSSKGVTLEPQRLPADSFQEFEIPPDMFDDQGLLTVYFYNNNNVALRFDLDDGFEVFYPESTFGLNFIRGLGIILCWLALLASVGLAASSWLSFPVAAFFSITVLIMGLCSGSISSAIEQGSILGLNHDTWRPEYPALDNMILPVFKGALMVIDLAKDFSPIDSLSTGRSITWGELGLAFSQIVLLLGGIFAAAGMILFTRRELAAVQSTS